MLTTIALLATLAVSEVPPPNGGWYEPPPSTPRSCIDGVSPWRTPRREAIETGNSEKAAELDAKMREYVARCEAKLEELRVQEAEDRKLAALRLDQQRQEAVAKAENERKQAEFDAESLAMLDNPKILRSVLSAYICGWKDKRSEALAGIAKEKKYARIGGVMNKAVLYDLQQDIAISDGAIRGATQRLREMRAKPESCTSSFVNAALGCDTIRPGDDPTGAPESCKTAAAQHAARAYDIFKPDFDVD